MAFPFDLPFEKLDSKSCHCHFQLLKSTQQANRVFALVELDRNKLADMWRMQLSNQRNKLQPLVERNNIANFSQWLEVSQALNDATSSRNLSLQLYALDGTPPAADLHHQLMQLLQTQPLTIAVQGSKPKLTPPSSMIARLNSMVATGRRMKGPDRFMPGPASRQWPGASGGPGGRSTGR